LLKVWAYLRFQQPSIAAHVSGNDIDLVYDVSNAEDLKKWMTESFNTEEKTESAGEVIKRARAQKY
jgi:hypothetical protein